MPEITITRKVRAEQWIEGRVLPQGTFECLPEVCWSADRSLVYFTYAEFRPRHWLGVARDPVPEGDPNAACGKLDGLIIYNPSDEPAYARKTLPFSFWSVKSEASVKRDHTPVYVKGDDRALLALWYDYCASEQWPNPIPRRLEYREINGSYGRGYRPIYMKPGDWLLHETVPEGHDNLGTKGVIHVMTDDEFRHIAAEPTP